MFSQVSRIPAEYFTYYILHLNSVYFWRISLSSRPSQPCVIFQVVKKRWLIRFVCYKIPWRLSERTNLLAILSFVFRQNYTKNYLPITSGSSHYRCSIISLMNIIRYQLLHIFTYFFSSWLVRVSKRREEHTFYLWEGIWNLISCKRIFFNKLCRMKIGFRYIFS